MRMSHGYTMSTADGLDFKVHDQVKHVYLKSSKESDSNLTHNEISSQVQKERGNWVDVRRGTN